MTLVDVAADSGGFLAAISTALGSLQVSIVALSALVEVLIIAMCLLVAIEVARGVMRR
jgi:predicted amino acid-binding ACT domain protein